MKYIKYSVLFAVLGMVFTSCLKSRSDAGGLLTDKGSVYIAIAEEQYISADAQNLGAGYTNSNASFNFLTRPNEAVQMFTIFVSQPRETKISGDLVIKVKMTDLVGNLPAGAIAVQDIVIPASSASSITVPIKYTVNKTGLNPASFYAVEFELTSANQGVIGANEKVIDVVFNSTQFPVLASPAPPGSPNNNRSDIEADYIYQSDVVDPANQFGVHNRASKRFLVENGTGNVEYFDSYYYAVTGSTVASNRTLQVNNYATGATTVMFQPRFIVNAGGQVTSIVNLAGANVSNVTLDPTGENRFVYTSNNQRTFKVKYTFVLTTTINGVVTPRTVSASEEFYFNPQQIYF